MNNVTVGGEMNILQLDTANVLNRDYEADLLTEGFPGIESPIFDRMAAERFGRND